MSLPEMAGETGLRPSLPISTQSSSFIFAPTSIPRTRDVPQQRNYVFVDEHNRHKRLKVMRACEGCRRRKIKCDAATTNSWPCAACSRLKLHCVPPTVSYDKDVGTPGVHTFELQVTDDFPTIPVGTISDFHRQSPMPHSYHVSAPIIRHSSVHSQYSDTLPGYSQSAYLTSTTNQDPLRYPSLVTAAVPREVKLSTVYPTPPPVSRTNASLDGRWTSEGSVVGSAISTAEALCDQMGELKIDHLAIAPYIADRNKLAEAPAVGELEIHLPQPSSSDPRIRIPLEMMPNENQAQHYFEHYFAHVHPFVPVLNQQSFHHQWNTNRESISPLLLEAVFACAAMVLEDHQEGNKWLALASRHEESFKDVPRLSTIQATLILMKARESAPKRGYFYRSWMTVVNLVAMAKDLDIHEHSRIHQNGRLCKASVYECVTKTRIWQLLYILEAMVGGPQGRSDFGVMAETVDLNPPRPIPGLNESEFQVSCQLTYFAQVVRNVRGTIILHSRLEKERPDFALDPEFTAHDANYANFLAGVPRLFQLDFPLDGSLPWVPSSFIGNMHCYHYLSIIMQHRPQIHYLAETDGSWKQHMIICHDAAKKMCRIQESMLQTQGMVGLLSMQRGISFTIYCVLTCTMLHLASITSPDPELNTDAGDFFARHMRILEQCTPHWPMPEVSAQINALREAFSADTSRPFELKSDFPFTSPAAESKASPLTDGAYNSSIPSQAVSRDSAGHVNCHSTHPITPPVSATDDFPRADSPLVQSLTTIAPQSHTSQGSIQHHAGFEGQWNPTKIFEQWNAAFGTGPSSQASQPSPPLGQTQQLGKYAVTTPMPAHQQTYSPQSGISPPAINLQLPGAVQTPNSYTSYPLSNGYVTPTMWQDAVASSFGDGMKRRWEY